MVVTEVRKYMEAAVEKLTPAKAQEMARSLMQGQAKGKEQVQKVAQDLMEWSNHTRERMTEMIRREVARQLKSMGVASKEEVEALKRRVRELERGGSRSRAAVPSAAKPAARTSTARTSAAKAAPAKAPTAKRPTPGGAGGTSAKSGS